MKQEEARIEFIEPQKQAIIDLLWDYLSQDREHNDRVYTGWGTKTRAGLIACIERIANNERLVETHYNAKEGGS